MSVERLEGLEVEEQVCPKAQPWNSGRGIWRSKARKSSEDILPKSGRIIYCSRGRTTS